MQGFDAGFAQIAINGSQKREPSTGGWGSEGALEVLNSTSPSDETENFRLILYVGVEALDQRPTAVTARYNCRKNLATVVNPGPFG
jgi:hypothetical protein